MRFRITKKEADGSAEYDFAVGGIINQAMAERGLICLQEL